MRIKCSHCRTILEVPASEFVRHYRRKGGLSSTPAQKASRSANITAYNDRRRAEKLAREALLPKKPAKRNRREYRPKRSVVADSIASALKGPYRDLERIEKDGKRLCRELALRSHYHAGLLQLVFEKARQYCRAKSDKAIDNHKRVIAKHTRHEAWPKAWRVEYGVVELPPPKVLRRFAWVSTRAVWLVNNETEQRVAVYYCEMM